jgi:hypothetical protein
MIKKLKAIGIYKLNEKPIFGCKSKEVAELYFNKFNHKADEDFYKHSSRIDIPIDNPLQGYIYVVANTEYGFCKIGYSTNPKERLLSIQTGCPFALYIQSTFKGTIETEKALHKKYRKYKSNGEWFFIEGELQKALF